MTDVVLTPSELEELDFYRRFLPEIRLILEDTRAGLDTLKAVEEARAQEELELAKSYALVRTGLLRIAELMESGRIEQAKQIVDAFVLGDRK